ncbi:hypothetical protein LCGC14_0954850 [marine sediment metagenome]|uniref:Ribbon-helix-helix protein CopG domain-containing protein n=1 Tax=marine sediment metagenome TaxID=412755 RepID=A0A0F9QZH3_9ZZZZ
MKTDKKIMAYLPESLYRRSKRFTQKLDISIAELIRRALERYLGTQDK